MARPGRPERNRAARSFRQLRRFHHGINSNKVFGTHKYLRALEYVSIHAPVKEATGAGRWPPSTYHVSIHAPVKEATTRGVLTQIGPKSFDPRPREGGDEGMLSNEERDKRFGRRPRERGDARRISKSKR